MNEVDPSQGEARARFLRGSALHLQALRSIRQDATDRPEEAARAVSRLCGFLQREATRVGLEEVAAAAKALEGAGPQEVEAGAEHLEAALLAARAAAAPATILLVEDEATTIEIVRSALTADGHRILAAGTGARALELASRTPPDLILLDIVLPDLDGRSLLQQLRRLAATRRTPIVVLSAKLGAGVKAECFAYGADGYIEKPADPAGLLATLSPFLAGATSEPVGPQPLPPLPGREEAGERFEALQRERVDSAGAFTAALLAVAPAGASAGGGQDGGAPGAGRASQTIEDSRESARGLPELLAEVCSALRARLRAADVLVRWNADELLLLAPEREPVEIAEALDQVRAEVATDGGTFSAGVVPVGADAFLVEVVGEADRRLARALQEPAGSVVRGTPPLARGAPPGARTRRVVVAEDDRVTAALVRHHMERSGFEVEHRENGREAWDLIREAPPALVVLDIQMPGMNGLELLARMRGSDETRAVPAILLTSLGGDANIARAFERGADDYLVKPFSPGELIARALRLVRHR